MKIAIANVKVAPDRFRTADAGAVTELAKSFKDHGQLQPIILTGDDELVAGLHRLTAAKQLGWTEIEALYKDCVSDRQQREIELVENLVRLELTWQEKVRALAELDRMKAAEDPNWTQTMTGVVAGVARERIAEATRLDKLMQYFPEIKDAKTVTQALSWASSKAASVVRLKEVRTNPARFQAVEEKVWLDDSVEAIKRVPPGMFRLVLTDPPFGIGYDRRKAGAASASAYKDDEESYQRILSMAPELYRVVRPNGWLVWFLGPTWYERAKVVFREAGFTVDEIPLIWLRTAGRCYTARPDRYFARGYDMALHCLKGEPEMVIRNRHNVFDFPPIPSREQELLVERPVELYVEIIKHLTHPGETIADFFVGSGSVLAAAAETGRDFFGVEIDPERRAVAIKKIEASLPNGQ